MVSHPLDTAVRAPWWLHLTWLWAPPGDYTVSEWWRERICSPNAFSRVCLQEMCPFEIKLGSNNHSAMRGSPAAKKQRGMQRLLPRDHLANVRWTRVCVYIASPGELWRKLLSHCLHITLCQVEGQHILAQCWFDVGPTLKMLAHRLSNLCQRLCLLGRGDLSYCER